MANVISSPPRRGDLLRRRRHAAPVPLLAGERPDQRADLQHRVRAAGDRGQPGSPLRPHLVGAAPVRTTGQRDAEVVGDDPHVGAGPRPGAASSPSWVWYAIASYVNAEATERANAGPERVLAQDPGPRGVVPHRRRVPGRVVAHTAEPAPPASSSASTTGCTASPSVRSAWPTMPAIGGPSPRRSASSATDATHSTSPTGRSSAGPSVRYCEWHSTNTVCTTLWPRARVGRAGRPACTAPPCPRASHRWWWASQIGRSGSRTASLMGRPYAEP